MEKHFYTTDGLYSKDPEDKKNIEDISAAVSNFYYPIYEKYRAMGYPAVEICQVLEDQINFGLLHYRLETAAKLAKESKNKASD